MALNPEQAQFWHTYLEGLQPEVKVEGSVGAACPGGPEIADQLIDVYLAGRKVAGSGLVEGYRSAGDPLPEVGDHWIALDSDGRPRCILRTATSTDLTSANGGSTTSTRPLSSPSSSRLCIAEFTA